MPAEFAMRAVFLLMLVLGALTPQRLQAAEEERAAFVQESREMVQTFAHSLKGELQAAIAAGGPIKAISVCHVATGP